MSKVYSVDLHDSIRIRWAGGILKKIWRGVTMRHVKRYEDRGLISIKKNIYLKFCELRVFQMSL